MPEIANFVIAVLITFGGLSLFIAGYNMNQSQRLWIIWMAVMSIMVTIFAYVAYWLTALWMYD